MNALQLAFIGPLVGAMSRSVSGWVADKLGGARVTFWDFVAHDDRRRWRAVLPRHQEQPRAFSGFFVMFLVLFFATGVGNASTFRMIPVIILKEMRPADAGRPDAATQASGRRKRNARR